LHKHRQKYGGEKYLGPSFPAIVGSGPNGAIVHYRPHEGTSLKVTDLGTNILIDTGAHYMNGTTDTTRTIVFSEPLQGAYLKEMYTRVLMGNLDLQAATFPGKKTFGMQIESFARQHLWQVGKDFGHGLGHGVSHCGPVHEYPHYAFARSPQYQVPLTPGMVITNEPGYYETNEFGIRIENILTVTTVQEDPEFLGFENLTLVPYCKQLIDKQMLSEKHKHMIRDYYDQIEMNLKARMQEDADAAAYLNEQLDF
jgi:Xaa-Pro aminopeptidase